MNHKVSLLFVQRGATLLISCPRPSAHPVHAFANTALAHASISTSDNHALQRITCHACSCVTENVYKVNAKGTRVGVRKVNRATRELARVLTPSANVHTGDACGG
jgi:hypothetical protein